MSKNSSNRSGYSRRDMLRLAGWGAGAWAVSSALGCGSSSDNHSNTNTNANATENTNKPPDRRTPEESTTFQIAVVSDIHLIDEYYKGPENTPKDTESILKANERFDKAVATLNAMEKQPEFIILPGDIIHDYPSKDKSFYETKTSAVDHAKAKFAELKAPIHAGFGNHDYDIKNFPREFTHELFKEKLGINPYYHIDHKGWRFIHLNNFMGETWNPKSSHFDKDKASFGEKQLNWLEGLLQEGRPTFIFVHFPLLLVKTNEIKDYDLLVLLKKYKDTIMHVYTGHTHIWLEFGNTYGPPMTIVGSTRYDEDNIMMLEIDTEKQTYTHINKDKVKWNTHHSDPV